MPTLPGEIADALVTVLETPAVQAELTAFVTASEGQLQPAADAIIANASGSGFLGLVINAAKGSVTTELNAELAKLPPTTIVAYITALAQQEAKALGG